MTIMFCSFTASPLILRLYGHGEVVRPGDARWNDLIARFTPMPGMRQIVLQHIESVQTSCGFAVPRFELVEDRQKLIEWSEKKGEDGLAEYCAKKNRVSIDGMPTGL